MTEQELGEIETKQGGAMSEVTLLPCFNASCAGNPKLYAGTKWYYVYCDKCYCRSPQAKNKESSIDNWNRL